MGFERAENEQGAKLSWRWQTRTEHGALMVLELLADAPQIAGGRVQPLPTEGTISALNIPHSSIVFDLYQIAEIRAELLGENGMATERVKHADVVSFTCLKAFAFDQRFERKDAHDLIYCIEHAPDGPDAVVAAFGRALAGKHAAVVREALDVLRRRFADDEATEGYRKDGPVSVAKFELGEGRTLSCARPECFDNVRPAISSIDSLLESGSWPCRSIARQSDIPGFPLNPGRSSSGLVRVATRPA